MMIKNLNHSRDENGDIMPETIFMAIGVVVIGLIMCVFISNIITLQAQEVLTKINKDKQTSQVIEDTGEKFRR